MKSSLLRLKSRIPLPTIGICPNPNVTPPVKIADKMTKEFEAFYTLPATVPDDAPYVWAQGVQSVDGNIAWHSGSPLRGSKHDWATLEYGWSQADAVVGSASTLRNEDISYWGRPGCTQIVLTRSLANVPWSHPLVNNSQRSTIVVVDGGNSDEADGIPPHVEISREPIEGLLQRLRSDGVRFAEVSGGRLTGLLMARKLISEIRLTIRGVFTGSSARMFNLAPDTNAPTLKFRGVRWSEEEIFIRAAVEYRTGSL